MCQATNVNDDLIRNILKEPNLSLDAKGLMAIIIHISSDDKCKFEDIYSCSKESKNQVNKFLHELIVNKYVEINSDELIIIRR